MRRTAAALATLTLVAVALAGPMVTFGSAAPAPIRCSGTSPSSECALLDQLAAQLGPMAPVLALGGPAVTEAATAVQTLASRADQPGGVPTAVVADEAQALLDQLAILPNPVRSLLTASKLDGLIATLETLIADVTAVSETAAAPLTGATPAPAAAAPAPAPAPSAAAAGPAPTALPSFGESLSAAGTGEVTRTTSSPAIPDVPVGDPLTLAPLALPEFGFNPTIGLGPAADAASSLAASGAVDEAQLAVDEALGNLPSNGNGPEIAVVVVMSILLLGAAIASQAHQNRHTIPD